MPQIFRKIWHCLTSKCRNCGLTASDPELRAISPLDSTDHAGNLKSWTPHRSQTDSWHIRGTEMKNFATANANERIHRDICQDFSLKMWKQDVPDMTEKSVVDELLDAALKSAKRLGIKPKIDQNGPIHHGD